MNCSNCNNKLFKKDKLCQNCKFDDNVTISKTNVKIIYKLTDDDINDPDLYGVYYFTFRIQHGSGTRFLIQDIEKLVEELSECSISDKRYIALTKIRNERNDQNNYNMLIKKNKADTKDFLKTLIEKSDQDQFMEHKMYLIENDFYLDMDKYIVDNINIMHVCEKLLDEIEKKAPSIYELNKLIKTHFKKDYNKVMKVMRKNSNLYKECIDKNIYKKINEKYNSTLLNKLLDELKQELSIGQQNKKSNEIEKLLKKQNKDICKHEDFLLYVRTNTKYKQYVNGSLSDKLTFNNSVDKIGKSIRKKIEKSNRKVKIDEIIDTQIDCKYLDTIKEMYVYKKYINNDEGDINNVIKELIAEFTKIQQCNELKQKQLPELKQKRCDAFKQKRCDDLKQKP